MTRETYTENITYDYPYETYVINNVKYVQVELEDDEDDTYVQTYIEAERENAIELYTANNTSFVNENFMARDMSVVYVSQYSPCILADLNITKITNLLEKTDVEYIEYIDFKNLSITEATSENEIETISTNISASSIENAMDLINADTVSSAFNVTGDSVKIGQIEPCCPSENSVVKNSNYNNTNTSWDEVAEGITHANNVYNIMNAMAPEASYYAIGNYMTSAPLPGDLLEQIEWLISNGVNIINMSMGYKTDFDTYNGLARWIDHIAINHNVHFVIAAGNYDNTGSVTGVWSPGMAYNAITVGSVSGNTDLGKSGFSAYNDDGISVSEQRTYKPDVMAPGNYGENMGTSFAAPLVTGTIALMCEYTPSLKTQPFAVKAILAATTLDVRSYITVDDEFERYGAGVIDVTAAITTLINEEYNEYYCNPNATGVLSTYTMVVSALDVTRGVTKRIALTYGNQISYTSSSNHIEDMPSDGTIAVIGIAVYNANGSYITGLITDAENFGANLKVVEFDAAQYGAGTYTIQVILQQKPSDNRVTRYAVAWE